jgi:hypothetical protein
MDKLGSIEVIRLNQKHSASRVTFLPAHQKYVD